MNDVRQLALKLFEIEKKHLLEEKQEYSCAVVIVITPERRYYEEADFDDATEKDAVYGATELLPSELKLRMPPRLSP